MLQQLYDRSPVALQTFMLNVRAAELHFERYGRKYSRAERQYARSESMSSDEMRAWQNGRLVGLIEHALSHSNFHRLLNQTFYSALHLSKADIGVYVEHIRSNGVHRLEGCPSTVSIR